MSALEVVGAVVVTILVMVLLTTTKWSPLGFIIRRLTRPTAVLIDWDSKRIRFAKIDKNQETFTVGNKDFLRDDVKFLYNDKWFGLRQKSYAIMLEKDVRPVIVSEEIDVSPMSPDKLFAAIREEKSTQFMRSGIPWQILVIIALVIAVLALAFAR